MPSMKVNMDDTIALIHFRISYASFHKALMSNIVRVPFALEVQITFGSIGDKLNTAGIQVNGTEASSSPVATSQTLILWSFEATTKTIAYFPAFLLLSSLHSIWQLAALVFPPLCQGLM